jgi:hypothetical protein
MESWRETEANGTYILFVNEYFYTVYLEIFVRIY